jgi:TonB-linked SusC/RagA family outer membrane protein
MKKFWKPPFHLNEKAKKLILTMKLTVFILFLTLMQVSATVYSQATKFSFRAENKQVVEVLRQIEENSDFRFFFLREQVDVERKVTVTAREATVEQILEELFRGEPVSYEFANEALIVLTRSDNPLGSVSGYMEGNMLQPAVSGTVTDETGLPLPGVTVLVKGTTQGTVTNADGNYSLTNIPEDATLVFSFVGMLTREIEVGNQTTIDVTMEVDAIGIEEVVAIGYGVQKKVNLTGAISSVSSQELDARPITNMTSALSGLATGVHISQTDGQPGKDGATIRIRGIGTLNNANPLVLIDGIEAGIDDVNPNDVESISVLKDAASSAIYGSRAANGVILVTTKKGKVGDLKVSYNGYHGWQSTSRMPEYLSDMATYMEIANEAWTNSNQAAIFSQDDIVAYRNNPDPVFRPSVDWVDVWYGDTAPMQSHSLSFSGGTIKTVYNFSLAYLDQKGITPDTYAKRYNFRMNWESSILDNLKIGTNLSGVWKDLENPEGGVFEIVPGIPYEKHPDGRYGNAQVIGVGTVLNPRALWENTHNLERNQNFLGKLYLNWEIVKDLTFSSNYAIKFNNGLNRRFNANVQLWNFATEQVDRELGDPTRAINNNSENYTITNYNTLNYSKIFAKNHDLNILIGSSVEKYRDDSFNASIDNFHNNELFVLNAGLDNPQVGGSASEWSLVSFFSRLNYTYKGKYLFEGNVRYDGSSRFKEGNKWGLFPSFSAGWRISEEGFLQDVAWLDNLKIRASWGELGNQNIGNYPYQTSYTLGQNYSLGGNVTSGIASTAVVNSDIKWETTTSSNVGVDATLFGKLNVTAEYFHRLTDGILIGMNIPKTMGDKSNPVVNLAEVVNQGWELSANYQDNLGDLTFSLGFNVSNVQNEVTKYQGEVRSGGNFVTWEGYSFQSMYGYVADGLIRSQEELDALNAKARELSENPAAWYITNKTQPGDVKYKDLDGNGIIDSNDREVIGNTIPEYTYGFNLNLDYKGFDVTTLLQGVYGRDTYLGGVGIFPIGVNGDRGMFPYKWVTDRFIPSDESTWANATLPRVVQPSTTPDNYRFSSFWKQDASYLRVKTIQLGYTLPNTASFGIERLRLYVNGENLFTFTDFDGFDPDRSATATGITQYPLQKTISAGVQVTF